METVTTENSVIINRPIEEVFNTATCMESCINWWAMVKDAKKVSTGPTAVGTEYRHIGKFMGIPVETHPVITVLDAPHHFAFKSETSNAAMDVDFNFEPLEGGTKLTITMIAHPKGGIISQAVLPVIVNAAGRQFSNDMVTLKDMMENGVQVKLS